MKKDLKIVPPAEGQLTGRVTSVTFKGVHYEMMVASHGFSFMVHSTQMAEPGSEVGLSVIPFDIQIMKKSGGEANG